MKSKSLIARFLLCFLLVSFSFPTIALTSSKESSLSHLNIIGLQETVAILPENMHLSAKIDTGAQHSSLDAQNIELFTRDDKEWVRFQVTRAQQKRIYIIERPLIRSAKIKRRANEAGNKEPQSRPVVLLQVCVGDTIKEIEVNLTDRSHFKYPFLLGYSGIIEFQKVVNPVLHNTLPLTCGISSESKEK